MIFRYLGVLAVAGATAFTSTPASAQSGAYVCMKNPNYNRGQWIRFERVRNGVVNRAGTFYFRPRQSRQIRTGYGPVRYCWGYTRNAVASGCRPGYIRYARKGYCAGGGSGGPPPGRGGGPGYGGGGGGGRGSISCFRNTNQYRGAWFRIESVRGGRVVSASNFYIRPGQTRRYRVPYGYARWCWSVQRSGVAGGCRPGYWRTVVRNNC